MKPEALIIHPSTQASLEQTAKQLPHGLLFLGPVGIGKRALAAYWAELATGKAYGIEIVEPDEKSTISIEAIRRLYRSARSKRADQQVIIVDHAEAMGIEAQNAFLKLLEEPRIGVTFILTAPHRDSLLPTITSRLQQLYVRPVGDAILKTLCEEYGLSPNDTTQYTFIADGRPATLMALLNDPQALARERAAMQQAKELLMAKPYSKLLAINKLATDRVYCIAVLSAMLRMAGLQLKKSAKTAQIRHWSQTAEDLDDTLQALVNNGNIKAQLLRLFVAL